MGKYLTYNDATTLNNGLKCIDDDINKLHQTIKSDSKKAWRQRRKAVQRKPYGKHGVRR